MAKFSAPPWRRSLFANWPLSRFWPVIMLWVLIGSVDLWQRFLPKFGLDVTDMQTEPLMSELQVNKLSADVHEMYLSKLAAQTASEVLAEAGPLERDTKEPDTSNVNGAWQNEGSSYYLIAIFGGSKDFAVVDRYDHLTNVRDTLEVSLGDVVGGRTVTGMTALTLELTSPDDERFQLALFTPTNGAD